MVVTSSPLRFSYCYKHLNIFSFSIIVSRLIEAFPLLFPIFNILTSLHFLILFLSIILLFCNFLLAPMNLCPYYTKYFAYSELVFVLPSPLLRFRSLYKNWWPVVLYCTPRNLPYILRIFWIVNLKYRMEYNNRITMIVFWFS